METQGKPVCKGKGRKTNSRRQCVMLRLEVQHDDKWLFFERQAPLLPKRMAWHKGLWFDDGGDRGCTLCVEAVYVDADGNVSVVFEERYHSNSNEESVTSFTDYGWTLVPK